MNPRRAVVVRRNRRIANPTRGGILFEAMLAIALFAGAGAITLACVRSVTHTLDRSARQQQAVDLARSRLAELEAGLTTLGGLRGEFNGAVGSMRRTAEVDEDITPAEWRFEVATRRSEFAGLTLVELTIIENLDARVETTGASPLRYTLRQLVALRESDEEGWAPDELAEDLAEDLSAEPEQQ